jgi:hypothetical protein
MKKSNLQIKSNLMIEKIDGREIKKSKEQIQFFPGDFAALIEPYRMKDVRIREQYFTQQQIIEYQQIIVCFICKKPCAGTCQQ